jgi:ankyrin repeat protein
MNDSSGKNSDNPDPNNILTYTLDLSDFKKADIIKCFREVRELKEKGELDKCDENKMCKLQLAVCAGDLLMVLVLLQNGASHTKYEDSLNLLQDICFTDDFIHSTPLIIAVRIPLLKRDTRITIVNFLLQFEQNLKIGEVHHRTAAQWATKLGFPDILDALLKKDPAVVNFQDFQFETMMKCAIKKCEADIVLSCELVSVLITHVVNVNEVDERGNTPLHLAVALRSIEIATILLKKNVNKNIKNARGMSPIDIARDFHDKDMEKLLNTGHQS